MLSRSYLVCLIPHVSRALTPQDQRYSPIEKVLSLLAISATI